MAKLYLVEKKVRMSRNDIIKFQLITHFYIHHFQVSPSELDILADLGKIGEIELTNFCKIVAKNKLDEKLIEWNKNPNKDIKKIPELSAQSIRNVVSKLEKLNLIIRPDSKKRKIMLNPEIKVQSEGNILLDFKIAHIDSKKS